MGNLDGRCLCGAVSYTSSADPLFTAVCHCKNCQRQSGTAFSVVVGVAEDAFELRGELAEYATPGDDHPDAPTLRRFCARCGSPVLSVTSVLPGVVVVKAGTLDDTSWIEPQLEVWGSSAQPWVQEADGRPRVARGPGG